MKDYTLKQYALSYAKKGLAVFPLIPRDKKPATKHGFKNATTDFNQIQRWWNENPQYNVGIATGKISNGLVVIDLDIDEEKGKDGYHELKKWEKENGLLPETWQTITGRGGYHLYYQTDKVIQSGINLLAGIDIRGEGGYIVAPPSIHPNGNCYEWEQDPNDFQLMIADETVLKLLYYSKIAEKPNFCSPNQIKDGERNTTLFKLASSLQAQGLADSAILAAVTAENEAKCFPALSDKEIDIICKSVGKYDKGTIKNTAIVSVEDLFARNIRGEIKQTIGNCVLALDKDEHLKGKFCYNLLTNQIDIIGDTNWKRDSISLTDNDVNNVRLYLEQTYGLTSEKGIPRAISIIAYQNNYHPIKEVLNSLKWDGKSYMDNMLTKYLGVGRSKYTAEVIKIFMLGAINRVFNPGSKFDIMPCIVGGQGIGKSTFFRLLALKDEWFTDELRKLDDENVYRKIQGHWIIEFSEMLATSNAKSIEEIKSFITRQKETYKIPYETHPQDRLRQCVFCGTTNNIDFLPKDRTGNRRFIPLLADESRVEVHPLENETETRNYIKMAWAEAMEIYRSKKYSLMFSKELEGYLREIQKEFVTEDVNVGIIQSWLDSNKPDFVCSLMIYKEALGNSLTNPKPWELKDINDIMNNSIVGYEKYRKSSSQKRFKEYGKQRAWLRKNISEDTSFVHIQDSKEQIEIPFSIK